MAKVKVVYWKKEINKWVGPLHKKMKDLFREYEKYTKEHGISSTADHNELWRKRFKARYDHLDKRIDEAYRRLWLKYHLGTGSTAVKPGYKLIR